MDFEALRHRMVDTQIVGRGIRDRAVIEAMRHVPRHEFVLDKDKNRAYDDCPLPIGEGQTISQPYIVALMTENLALNKTKNVLEIGTGSGYQTAILVELALEVYSIERIASLAERTRSVLDRLHYDNVHFLVGDGSEGFLKSSGFDAIIVTASCPEKPVHLFEQLKDNGRLIAPVGDRENQVLILFIKIKDEIKEHKLCACVFVPLLGKYGWTS